MVLAALSQTALSQDMAACKTLVYQACTTALLVQSQAQQVIMTCVSAPSN